MLRARLRAGKSGDSHPSIDCLGTMPHKRHKPDSPIIFNVGPWAYTVHFVPGLHHADSEPCVGRCDLDRQTIYISEDVPYQGRLNVVLHELRHAWSWHFPKPSNVEEECDFAATIIASAYTDLRRQREKMRRVMAVP